MKKLRFNLNIKITNEDTGEVLCENATEVTGNTQSVVHATEGVTRAVAYAFEIAGSKEYMEKQRKAEPLK